MEDEQQQEPTLAHARSLARYVQACSPSGAAVILAWLVPVVQSEEHFFKQVQVEPGSSGARRKDRGEAYLSEAVLPFQESGLEVVSRVVVTPSPPEQAIVELAQEEGVDLIIMPTLSQSAVSRFLFGSVGEKVRRRSSIPVLFVREPLHSEDVSRSGEEGE
jgi:nucleotide-binding universal stress UspA family protein